MLLLCGTDAGIWGPYRGTSAHAHAQGGYMCIYMPMRTCVLVSHADAVPLSLSSFLSAQEKLNRRTVAGDQRKMGTVGALAGSRQVKPPQLVLAYVKDKEVVVPRVGGVGAGGRYVSLPLYCHYCCSLVSAMHMNDKNINGGADAKSPASACMMTIDPSPSLFLSHILSTLSPADTRTHARLCV